MHCCDGNIYNAIRSERDLLDGNLNRMTLCDTEEELNKMLVFAHLRITNLFRLQSQRLMEIKLDAEKNKTIDNNNL